MFAVIILSSPSVQNVCEYVRICDQSGCESLSALQQHSPAVRLQAGAVAVSPLSRGDKD